MVKEKDDLFTPRLGRLRDLGKASGKQYIRRVLKAAGKINSRFAKGGKSSSFTGRNIGRGGKVLNSRQAFRQRRVVIKGRFIKLAGAGFRKAAAHLRYIQRDGVTKEGEPGQIYNEKFDRVDGDKFLKPAREDRHQFRFIVSPEDTNDVDLKQITRDLMKQAEKDLGTKLDWVAVDHYNTDNPHSHIILRGVDDQGRDLIISRDYISRGLRARASEIMTKELGPRQNHEIEQAMCREVKQNRFTSLDRNLLRQEEHAVVDLRSIPATSYKQFRRGLELARLEKLQNMGLADQVKPGVWILSEELEKTLRDLGQREDIIKTMHRDMILTNRNSLSNAYEIFRPQDQPDKIITGRLLSKGLSDEFNDRYYMVVEGVDGKTHYADVGQVPAIEDQKIGSVVELKANIIGANQPDRTIEEIARQNGGIYNEQLHRQFDPKASQEYIKAHVRRLEAVRRANIATHDPNGSWKIPGDYMKEVSDLNQRQLRRSPIKLTVKSVFSLEVQTTSSGATWLDRQLVGKALAKSNVGFGGEVEQALKKRTAYLIDKGFAKDTSGTPQFSKGLLGQLAQNELSKVGSSYARQTGKNFKKAIKGDRLEGVYTKSVELANGRHAIIEKTKEFSIVPWRPVLERAKGKAVSGVISARGISWEIGRQRGPGVT